MLKLFSAGHVIALQAVIEERPAAPAGIESVDPFGRSPAYIERAPGLCF